jgi:CubicO group peptidase (beta-lactamase class C family)
MSLIALPTQPAGVPWPTQAWPEGPAPAPSIRKFADYPFTAEALPDLGQTHALVVIQGGQLVLERYAEGFGPGDTYPSWSKAKSITQALVGIAAGDGKLDVTAPADVAEWAGAGDPRATITLDLLLRMSSGLAFVEDYVPEHPSDVIAMLFGEGKDDVAHYAASQPLEHSPASFWSYSSGTTNIVSRCIARALDAHGPDFEAFMRTRLFDPLGMTSAAPRFDAAGTFIGSSWCFCTARDFARFGLLYLRDGVWDTRRILPEGWVDYARTETWAQPNDDGPYGAHWWLGLGGPGSFSANGYDGQYTIVVPDLDMVVVRHGATPLDRRHAPRAWLGELIARFRQAI